MILKFTTINSFIYCFTKWSETNLSNLSSVETRKFLTSNTIIKYTLTNILYLIVNAIKISRHYRNFLSWVNFNKIIHLAISTKPIKFIYKLFAQFTIIKTFNSTISIKLNVTIFVKFNSNLFTKLLITILNILTKSSSEILFKKFKFFRTIFINIIKNFLHYLNTSFILSINVLRSFLLSIKMFIIK